MPLYDYACRCGETLVLNRPIAERDATAVCPDCKRAALRTMPLRQFGPDRKRLVFRAAIFVGVFRDARPTADGLAQASRA